MQVYLVSSLLFCDITTGIGLLHQALNRISMLCNSNNTDTYTKLEAPAFPFKYEFIDILTHFLANCLRTFYISINQQNAKLISTQTPDAIIFTQVIFKFLSQELQYFVTSSMTAFIINNFEMVKIQVKHDMLTFT
jgi:hypothetical protein